MLIFQEIIQKNQQRTIQKQFSDWIVTDTTKIFQIFCLKIPGRSEWTVRSFILAYVSMQLLRKNMQQQIFILGGINILSFENSSAEDWIMNWWTHSIAHGLFGGSSSHNGNEEKGRDYDQLEHLRRNSHEVWCVPCFPILLYRPCGRARFYYRFVIIITGRKRSCRCDVSLQTTAESSVCKHIGSFWNG